MTGIVYEQVEGVNGPEGRSAGGGSLSLLGTIIQARPTNFFSMYEAVASTRFSNSGIHPSPSNEDVTITVAPTLAAITPMALEPGTLAPTFNGTTQQTISTSSNNLNYTAFTAIAFIRQTTLATSMIWDFGNSGGAFQCNFQALGGTALFFTARDGVAGDTYSSQWNSGGLTVNVWSMIAMRQPADGTGVNWFKDGIFAANGDVDVTNILAGNATNNWSFNDINGLAGTSRFAISHAANTSFGQRLTGNMFGVVIDETIWTDEQLTALWNLALAQGLNG